MFMKLLYCKSLIQRGNYYSHGSHTFGLSNRSGDRYRVLNVVSINNQLLHFVYLFDRYNVHIAKALLCSFNLISKVKSTCCITNPTNVQPQVNLPP